MRFPVLPFAEFAAHLLCLPFGFLVKADEFRVLIYRFGLLHLGVFVANRQIFSFCLMSHWSALMFFVLRAGCPIIRYWLL